MTKVARYSGPKAKALGDTDHAAELARLIDAKDQPADLIAWHYLRAAVQACGGNVSLAAERLGMHRRTVQRMLDRRPKHRVEPQT